MAIHSLVDFDELNLDEALAQHQLDFDSWTILISDVEKKYHDDVDKLSLAYDSFLSEFPLCCGYWRKYAGYKARLCSVEEVVEIYERAVEAASFSVDIWVDYCSFSISVFEDPFDVCRLFRRGLSFIGKDYLCHTLWDKYIEFEFSQKRWSSLAHIYIEALKFPTKKLHQYYESFKKLVTIWREEMRCQGDSIMNLVPESTLDENFTAPEDDEVSCVIDNLLEPSTRPEALQKYLSIGEHLYKRASQLDLKIMCFETNIYKTYFHVKPLDDNELENWHHYLDFVEINGDFDWAVKLYERCLIPCASYSEFWMRYVEYVESKGGREIANDALERATRIFLKNLPAMHLFNAGFKEQIGDICGARTEFLQLDLHSESSFIDHVMRRSNMERRLGNNIAASSVYKEALAVAAKKKPDALPILHIQFSRLQYMVTNSVDAAREILIDGIRLVANCKLLLEELINFAMNHEGARQINILDSIILDAITPGSSVSRGLSSKDRQDISELYIQFVDLCGTIHDSRRAWNRHLKLFPHSLRGSSGRKISADGTRDTIPLKPKEVTTGIDKADNTENVKDLRPDENDTCKADDVDHTQEQRHVSVQDEPPSLDILSLNERDDESHNLASSTNCSCKSHQEASPSNGAVLERQQNVEVQPSSGPLNAHVNNSGQGNGESPSNLSTPSAQSPRCSEDRKDQEWSLSPPNRGSPKRQQSSEGKHDEDRFVHPQRRRSRWSSVEGQGEEQSHAPRQRLSPDERGVQSYSGRIRQNRPVYYDNSRSERGRRIQNEKRGAGAHAKRAHNVQRQRFTSASQMQPPGQPVGYVSGQMGQYPMQSNEQYANMQSSQAYNQMWQCYYYQQQQQLLLLQQQSYPNLQQQQLPQQQLQQQQQLQSQSNQMQLLQLQYQQMQLQYQHQLQQQQQQQQPQQQQPQQQADQHLMSQVQQTQEQLQQLYQQMQLQQQQQQAQQQQEHSYQQVQIQEQQHQMQLQEQMQAYQYQQQYLLYLQQLQQLQQQPGGSSQAQLPQQQVLSAEQEEQKESQLQQKQQLPPQKQQHQQQDGDQVLHTEDKSDSSQINP